MSILRSDNYKENVLPVRGSSVTNPSSGPIGDSNSGTTGGWVSYRVRFAGGLDSQFAEPVSVVVGSGTTS